MRTGYINKWQRLILCVGAIICFVYSFAIWRDNDNPAAAFLAGIILAVLALSTPRAGDDVLPTPQWARRHARALMIAALALVGGATAITIFGVSLVSETSVDAVATIPESAVAPLTDADERYVRELQDRMQPPGAAATTPPPADDPFPELEPYIDSRRVVRPGENSSWLEDEIRHDRDARRAPR